MDAYPNMIREAFGMHLVDPINPNNLSQVVFIRLVNFNTLVKHHTNYISTALNIF